MSKEATKGPSKSLESILTTFDVREDEEHFQSDRTKVYNEILMELQNISDNKLQTGTAKTLLGLSAADLSIQEVNKVNAPNCVAAVSLILSILKKIKEGKCELPYTELEVSALTIIKIISKIQTSNLPEFMKLAVETLLMFPDEIFSALVHVDCSALLNIFSAPRDHFTTVAPVLVRLLKVLPEDRKKSFLRLGTDIWFTIFLEILPANKEIISQNIEVLELLTDNVVQIDYKDHPTWEVVLNNICDKKRFPFILKELLANNFDHWHRLWIMFIKLLKDEITKVNKFSVSPINSLLPIVEKAFKMDPIRRNEAFECWNALIDNFSRELNESFINKRLNLLIIPLKLNNARVQGTVLVKLNTWWHLIQKFHSKMDKLINMVLIPFLQFCFGKPSGEKITVAPGQMTDTVAQNCVEALIEIIGHVDCHGCVKLPHLNGKLINTKILVDHWTEWVFVMDVAITTIAKCNNDKARQQLTCLWKGFVLTIGELPDNQIRADLFSELLKMVQTLLDGKNDKLTELIFEVMIPSLMDDKIKPLLKTKSTVQWGPLHCILALLQNPNMTSYTCQLETEELIRKLKPLTNFLLDPMYTVPEIMIEWLMKNPPANEHKLPIWASLAESICESECYATDKLTNVLLWPMKNMNIFSDERSAAIWHKWYKLYEYTRSSLHRNQKVYTEIYKILLGKSNFNPTNKCFMLCVTIVLLDYDLQENGKHFTTAQELEILQKMLNILMQFKNYKEIETFLPHVVGLLMRPKYSLSKRIMDTKNPCVAKVVIEIVVIILGILNTMMEFSPAFQTTHTSLVKTLLQSIDILVLLEEYQTQNYKLIEPLVKASSLVNGNVNRTIVAVLKHYLITAKDELVRSSVQTALDTITNKNWKPTETLDASNSKFTTPEPKSAKKSKKREPHVVNTVTENGENYEVIKSNWKFNPKKLTEAQKEKLKRKREDIPALYQDLSQSQDEFKLTAWKTDSQDASTTTSSKSNSKSTDDVSAILKCLPNTEVVPQIIEHILPQTPNKDAEQPEKSKPEKPVSKPQQPMPVKDPKTPRIALKDRVFRNVRNLIEKSGAGQGQDKVAKSVPEDVNQTVNEIELKTPETKSKSASNAAYSAPPKISSDRPARSIKKPKKFEDTELFALKKKRRSHGDSIDSNPEEQKKEIVTDKAVEKMQPVVNKELRKNKKQDIEKETVQENSPFDNIQTDISEVDNIEKPTIQIQALELNNTSKEKTIEAEKSSKEIDALENTNQKIDISEDNIESNTQNESQIMETDNCSQVVEETTISNTPIPTTKKRGADEKSTIKKKRSRIEKQLLIDMIEGHPLLQAQPEKRLTRKNIPTETMSKRKRSLIEKSNKIKADLELQEAEKQSNEKETEKPNAKSGVVTFVDSQEKIPETPEDLPMSEDVIESSQDSTLTTISVRSTTKKKCAATKLDKTSPQTRSRQAENKQAESQSSLDSDTSSTNSCNFEKQNRISRNSENTKESPQVTSLAKTKNSSKSKITETQKLLDNFNGDIIPLSDVELPNNDLPNKDNESTLHNDKESSNNKILMIRLDKNNALAETQNLLDDFNGDIIPLSDVELPNNDLPNKDNESTLHNDKESSNKKILTIRLDKDNALAKKDAQSKLSLDFNNESVAADSLSNNEIKDDIDLPKNKTVAEVSSEMNLTETMDTEPLENSDVIIIADEEAPIVINTEETQVGKETQEMAEADTLPVDIDMLAVNETFNKTTEKSQVDNDITHVTTQDNTPKVNTTAEVITDLIVESSNSGSPLKDNDQRKQDFMNDTVEISPIKSMSPIREKESQSPEKKDDYLVIKLLAPVQSNGEPYNEKCDSPEIFTEDKVSPDKRDQSPPRKEATVTNTSPSSSLSLKKNRPQMRSTGRAAQMLGLCVPENLQILNTERSENEEVRRSGPMTPARRNLRILYNTVTDNVEDQVNTNTKENETEESDNFLKFKRSLPTADSSPSVPILKRKLADITDEATVSPASKRKRVSFHDPPVSTTVAVQKYIEPCGIRSPQNSAIKRQERQLRAQIATKSPKRLDNVFRLESVLTKTVESFSDEPTVSNDTEMSLDETPAVEVIKTSELNDTDSICPELINCKDPIENIAGELSSPSTKALLIKELEGKVETVSDLAKMTELEVNRLCIKAPKVKVAKKVLTEYALKRTKKSQESNVPSETAKVHTAEKSNMEVQTVVVNTKCSEMQTVDKPVTLVQTQTDSLPISHNSAQTDESGSKSTKEIVATCLAERPDFIEVLRNQLKEKDAKRIVSQLDFDPLFSLIMERLTPKNSAVVLNSALELSATSSPNKGDTKMDLEILQSYLCKRFDPKDIAKLCIQLLQRIHGLD